MTGLPLELSPFPLCAYPASYMILRLLHISVDNAHNAEKLLQDKMGQHSPSIRNRDMGVFPRAHFAVYTRRFWITDFKISGIDCLVKDWLNLSFLTGKS